MTRIWIIILLIICAIVLISKYEPSIDIIVVGNRYEIVLWYNKHQWNHFINEPIVVRNYIQLFVI